MKGSGTMDSMPWSSASSHDGADVSYSTNSPFELVPPAETFPGNESILWTPWKLWLAGSEDYSPYEVVFEQGALETIREHIASDLDTEAVGLLIGQLHSCPETARRWVKVEDAIGPVRPAGGSSEQQRLEAAIASLMTRVGTNGSTAVGWYHSANRSGFTLSESEAEIHAKHFREPWQVALVLVADLARPAGGLFQRSEGGRIPRSDYRAFYELPDEESVLPDGRLRTFVGWQNYQTDRLVVRAFSDADLALQESQKAVSRELAEQRAWKITRRYRRRAIAAAAVLALIGSGWAFRDQLPLADATSVASGVASRVLAVVRGEEDAATGDVAPAMVFATPGDPATAQSTSQEFSAALEEFRQAARGYRILQASDDPGGIDCAQWTGAYQSVDEAFLRLSVAYSGGRKDTDPAAAAPESGQASSDYERAAEQMEAVDKHFDGSGCQRPG
jgi:proteasome lid subunit RPN8/RPN11